MLIRYAGLHCVSITGWAKGATYKPGERITNEPANHSWNAVYIDGSWFLLDCHWATRHDDSTDVKHDYDDFFFLTDPAEIIFSHFPEDAAWQLLPSPWTVGTLCLMHTVASEYSGKPVSDRKHSYYINLVSAVYFY